MLLHHCLLPYKAIGNMSGNRLHSGFSHLKPMIGYESLICLGDRTFPFVHQPFQTAVFLCACEVRRFLIASLCVRFCV